MVIWRDDRFIILAGGGFLFTIDLLTIDLLTIDLRKAMGFANAQPILRAQDEVRNPSW
jgi:hypothetical protein